MVKSKITTHELRDSHRFPTDKGLYFDARVSPLPEDVQNRTLKIGLYDCKANCLWQGCVTFVRNKSDPWLRIWFHYEPKEDSKATIISCLDGELEITKMIRRGRRRRMIILMTASQSFSCEYWSVIQDT